MSEWAGWLKEGHFISFEDRVNGVTRYAFVKRREFSDYVYPWPESIAPGTTSGPHTVEYLEPTVNLKQLFQVIFGIKGEVYLYVNLPVEIARHGLPKIPKHTAAVRRIGYYTQHLSPYDQPDWVTEHFLLRPLTTFIALTAYNPTAITVTPEVRFLVNKLELELLGYERDGELHPEKPRYEEVLEKLYRRVIPLRPVTLMPVRAPAEAQA